MGPFREGDVEHVVDRMVVVASREIPCTVEVPPVVLEAYRQHAQPTAGGVSVGPTPATAPYAGEEGVRYLFEPQPRSRHVVTGFHQRSQRPHRGLVRRAT